jgi:putative oxidoreductase
MKRTFSTQLNPNALNFWLLIARLAIGAFLLTHGIPKLQHLVAGNVKFPDPFHIGPAASLALSVFAEVGCSVLLILGLATRLATIPLIINLIVAIIYIHTADPFAKKELACVYLVILIGFTILGSGKFSIDSLLVRKSRRRY